MKFVHKAYVRRKHNLFRGEDWRTDREVQGYYLEDIACGDLDTPFDSEEDLLQEIKGHKEDLQGYNIVILKELVIPYDWE